MSATNKSFAKACILVGSAFGVLIANAQSPGIPQCVATHHLTPSSTYFDTVLGFPGQRLYLHPKHPRECESTSTAGCGKPSAYVVAGDVLSTGPDCDGWSYVSYTDKKKKTTTGWVASRRIDKGDLGVTLRFSPPVLEPTTNTPSESDAHLAHACVVTRDRLNTKGVSLNSVLPSILGNGDGFQQRTDIPGLPEVAAKYSTGSIGVSDVAIAGHALKALSYGFGGNVEFENVVELWEPDFSRRIDTGLSEGDGDIIFNTGDDVVTIDGNPYFIQLSNNSDHLQMVEFDKELSAHHLCNLTKFVTEKAERPDFAIDKNACRAALDGKVEDVRLDDITPYALAFEAIRVSADAKAGSDLPRPVEIVARGKVDIDNDGMPDIVGLAIYDEDSPHGGIFHGEWPVILDPDGTPTPHKSINMSAYEHMGYDDSSRLFRYRGTTYFEHHWRPDATEHSHEIWKFTKTVATQVCGFTTDRSQHYEIIDGQ